jgi:hypothetical protein
MTSKSVTITVLLILKKKIIQHFHEGDKKYRRLANDYQPRTEQKTRDALEVPIRVLQQLKIISDSSIRIRFDLFQLTCLEA